MKQVCRQAVCMRSVIMINFAREDGDNAWQSSRYLRILWNFICHDPSTQIVLSMKQTFVYWKVSCLPINVLWID
jgi:hypothetical protein